MPRPLGSAACYRRDARITRTDERSKCRAILASAMPCKEEEDESQPSQGRHRRTITTFQHLEDELKRNILRILKAAIKRFCPPGNGGTEGGVKTIEAMTRARSQALPSGSRLDEVKDSGASHRQLEGLEQREQCDARIDIAES